MKQEELDEILRLHKLWLAGEDGGKRAILEGAILAGADLKGASLEGAILAGADLEGANLEVANLKEADLYEASLKVANLEGAILEGANLEGASLEGANLKWANLEVANLEGANLEGANLDYASWPLWCGSLSVKIDARIAAQLAYHAVRACQSVKYDKNVVAFCNAPAVIELANLFHRVDDCGRIEAAEGCAI